MLRQKMLWVPVIAALTYAIEGIPVQKATKHAKVARDLVHKANWTAFSTISSTFKGFEGFPMVGVKSVVDDAQGKIFFLLTDLDFSTKDMKKKNNVTVLFTNEQDLSCSKNGIDPMEPTCSRVSISGSVVEIEKGTEEYEYGKQEFLRRHPAASRWVEAHLFKLYELVPKNIVLLNGYGGLHIVNPRDYASVKLR